MAQIGQTTPSGGREWNIYPQQAVLRAVTLPANSTLNHIGVWCREQTTANANDLKAGVYTSAGVLLATSNTLSGAISSTSTHALKQITFSGQSVSAQNLILFVVAGPASSGLVIVQGQNGSTGVPMYAFSDPVDMYASLPSDISTYIKTDAARQWDIYLDYTEAAAGAAGLLGQLQSHGECFL